MNHPISLPTKLEIAYLHGRNLTQRKIADETDNRLIKKRFH